MYSIYDYAYNGLLYLNNMMRPRHKRLSQLMIYSTTLCQSKCKHCNIWQKPVEHLSLEDIQRMMQSRCVTRKTTVGLEGGEFILHPQADEIMSWFQENHPNYTLLSNCLAPRRVINAIRRYQPRHLYVSLDGGRETYQRMRGRDGYNRVIEVVEALKDEVPLCQNLDVILGNIHEQSLDEIFNGASACKTQCQYSYHCNDCWINFHRKYDIILVRNLERLLPKWLIEKFYGPYQWTADPRTTYRKLMKLQTPPLTPPLEGKGVAAL